MADSIEEKILETATAGVARVKTDAAEVESIDLSKLIEADRYLKEKSAAASSPLGGLRIRKLVPPGPT